MKKEFTLTRQPIVGGEDAKRFETMLSMQTEFGYSLEACGMSSGCDLAWAIMSKPADKPPKEIDLLEAARMIAKTCKDKGADGCLVCPLNRGNACLASGSRIPAYWDITKEG